MLEVGQLVNRRVELRRLTRILLDDLPSMEEIGQKAGVQLCAPARSSGGRGGRPARPGVGGRISLDEAVSV